MIEPDLVDRDAHVQRIATPGWTVLESVVPEDLRVELVERIDRAMDEAGTTVGTNAFLGRHTRRRFNLLGHVDRVDPATWVDPDAWSQMVWDRIR